ncbi:hypothetical protein BpHYR1_021913 [Brachionus plicatilis]|uniref:Uncharacterized protein n=1 Tax=Brachionus plicatilis TaxID=10195 RepID=A0A3M7PLR6_BRAPC|nr:hypothetical protein BpHYR1_021913 [Brachionus plicatilis]
MELSRSTVQRFLFFVHFVLSVLAMSSFALPSGYLLSQSLMVAANFWTFINKETSEPFYMLNSIAFLTFFSDIIIVALNWFPHNGFQLAMALISIFVKPAIFLMSLNSARQLEGETQINIPSFGNWASPPTNYQQNPPQYHEQNFQANSAGYQGSL